MRKVLIVLLLIIAIVGMGGIWFIHSLPDAKDPASTEEITVEIPEGYGTNAIGELLEEQGVISSALKFKLYNRLSGNGAVLNAGTYTLSPSMDLPAIFEKLSSYEVDSMSFTIPEGLTLNRQQRSLLIRDSDPMRNSCVRSRTLILVTAGLRTIHLKDIFFPTPIRFPTDILRKR